MALLRDGPWSALAADALQATSVGVSEAPVFGVTGREPEARKGAWHQDRSMYAGPRKMVSLWLPLTEAPHGMEFLRGSHRVRTELTLRCNRSREGPWGERLIDHACSQSFVKERLEPTLGHASHWWIDLRPGDGVLFDGELTHRGVAWARPRVAVAMRFVLMPDSQPCNELSDTFRVYPRSPNAFACVHQHALPRPHWLWPWLDDRLPNDDDWGSLSWAARSLRRAVAAVSAAAFFATEEDVLIARAQA
uniref:Phytanoyl-CoA dioxygenase n=1 Tax=Pyrodinium bahamense TaxID=73915 RepID=A0A7S0BDN1_9DINO|mmetsp:Transcript_9796/g.27411  ORF Transcript_9796/g.27411 Transcript_9796/m.27411 type:complete len:249 (+) Transcript_9796:85-831(+)